MGHEVAIRELNSAIAIRSTQAKEYPMLSGTPAEKAHYFAEAERLRGEVTQLEKAIEMLEAT